MENEVQSYVRHFDISLQYHEKKEKKKKTVHSVRGEYLSKLCVYIYSSLERVKYSF